MALGCPLARVGDGRAVTAAAARWDNRYEMHDVVKFFRANPQAFALLVICLVLGLGTFIAVIVALITSGSATTAGNSDGLITAIHLLAI